MPRSTLTEARQVAEATPVAGAPGRFLIELITPGWGSSGYYSAEVLEQAAADRIFAAGMHMYLDHPTESEHMERPERSVRDLAAALAEDARWNGEALVAEATVFGGYREVLDQMSESIGVSIRAAAEVTEGGEAEGRRGRIIDRLVEGISADYVTHAGRGGRIAQVLESARPVSEARNIGQWIESRIHRDFTITADDMAGDGRLTREERISMSTAIGDALAAFVARLEADQPHLYSRDLWEDPQDTVAAAIEAHTGTAAAIQRAVAAGVSEATANDTRDALHDILRDAYGDEDTFVWVRDFDAETVWFEINSGNDAGLYGQPYTSDDDGAVALTGERTEVRVVTTYVPATRSDGTTTESLKEDTMPQIEEARLRELEEASGRVSTLESERDTEREARVAAEAERDQLRAREAATTRARTRVTEANGDLPTATVDRIVAEATRNVPLTESGELDETAFDTATDNARTAEETYLAGLRESAGIGAPRGFGRTKTEDTGEVSEADLDAELGDIFGTTVKGA